MNFRKNSVLIIGCGIASVLLVVAVFFLVKNQSSYRTSLNALNSSKARLQTLNNRNPFPSQSNVQQAGDNLGVLKAKYHSIQQDLQREQLKSEAIEPARFAPMLEQMSRSIRERAADADIQLPADAGLGFKDYAAGKLPPNDPAVLDRLVVQVRAIDDLFNVMLESKIGSIDMIERDQFENRAVPTAEQAANVRGRSRGPASASEERSQASSFGNIPDAETNPLYSTERFKIGITGRESAIWEAINRLVRSPVHYVIVDLTLANTATDLGKPVDLKSQLNAMTAAARTPAQAMGANMPTPTLASISREERVVGGREPVKAVIVLDMYRFTDDADGEGQP